MIEIPGRVLEAANGIQFIVCIGLTICFLSYLGRKLKHVHFEWWLQSTEIKLGWSLFLFVLGDTVIRGPVWYSRHLINRGIDMAAAWPIAFTTTTAVGTALCCWGGLCALRAATPEEAGEWPWMVMLLTAFIFGISMAWG